MKRVLSLVLALALVLGTIPAGFAATATAGETLKGYGLLSGDQNGNLNEDKNITRGEMMVVLAQLLGKFEEAKAYSIPSASKDVAGHWAANYIAFAEKEAWTSGVGNGMFDPNGKVSLQMVATFMLKALGYTVTDYAKVVEEATAKGLLANVVATEGTALVLRADVFTAALNTINAPINGSTQKLGEKLGVLTPAVATLDVKSAEAVSYKVVEVVLNTAATAVKAADFAVTDVDGKALEVKGATLIDSKTVWLDTADQTPGKVYTVKVGEKTAKFTGVAKDAAAPVVQATSEVVDNVTFKVVFDKEMDPRTALVAANYTVDNSLQVTKAAWNTDADGDDIKTEVILTTSAQTEGKLYTLTVATKVTDLAGNAVKSTDDANEVLFGGIAADTDKPELASALGENAVKVVLTFEDDSDLDKATAENIANYTITNKTNTATTVTVTKAELVKDAAGDYKVVELTTTAQTVGNVYEIAVKNVADKFGNVISTTSAYKTTFSGQPADTTGPALQQAEQQTNTSVKLTFDQDLDKASAETVANYVINNNLTVVKAVQDSDDENVVVLTTSSQTDSTAYKVTVSNVTDEYGNKIKSSADEAYFSGMDVDDEQPTLVSATAAIVSGKTIVTVTFSEAMSSTATVATNYYFGAAAGYGISVEKDSDTVYKVRINAIESGSNYTLTVSGVEDLTGNVIDSDEDTANFVGVEAADTEDPELVSAVAIDKNTIRVFFSKAMEMNAANDTEEPIASTHSNTETIYFEDINNYFLDDKNTAGYANLLAAGDAIAYVADDQKSVTFRLLDYTLEAGKVYTLYVNASTDVTGVAFDAAGTALTADNGEVIAAGDSSAIMGTSTTTAKTPEVVTAYAINTNTVDIKFTTPIALSTVGGVDAADIAFDTTAAGGVDTTGSVVGTSVLSSDNTILRVRTTAELTAGATYTITYGAAVVTDIFGDKALDNTDTDNNKTLKAPSTENDTPEIAAIETVSKSSIRVTFTETLGNGAATATTNPLVPANFTIVTDAGTEAAKFVEFDGSAKDKLLVYFDTTNFTKGKVYELTIAANGVVDSIKVGCEELTEKFANTSAGDERTEFKISDVVKVDGDTVRIKFNVPVSVEVAGTATLLDIISENSAAGISAITFYNNGTEVDPSLASPEYRFFNYIDVDFDAALTLNTAVTFDIVEAALPNAIIWTTKDGAAKATTSSKSYTAQ